MLGFITDQTKWYTDKAKALDNITEELQALDPVKALCKKIEKELLTHIRRMHNDWWDDYRNNVKKMFEKPIPKAFDGLYPHQRISEKFDNGFPIMLVTTPNAGKTMLAEYFMSSRTYKPTFITKELSDKDKYNLYEALKNHNNPNQIIKPIEFEIKPEGFHYRQAILNLGLTGTWNTDAWPGKRKNIIHPNTYYFTDYQRTKMMGIRKQCVGIQR